MTKNLTLGVGTNHSVDPLGSILDITLMTKISTLGGWGLITVGTPRGPFWTYGALITKISTLGGWDESRWGPPCGHFLHKGGPL